MKGSNLLHAISFFPEDTAADTAFPASSVSSAAALSPRALVHARSAVDYEFGKVFDKQDADRYFGGMCGIAL